MERTGLNMLEREERKWKVSNMRTGKLTIVATPIGNLKDITLRALETLKESDYILCEDTRVTKKLLSHYQINIPTISYHHHSGSLKIDKIISLLKEGNKLSLVSDAGTPGVSDPGGKLVKETREKLSDTIIESIPGPSALSATLSVSGINTDRFLFLGFLPHKKGRQTMIKEIIDSKYPVALFESKHRVIKLLEELIKTKVNLNIFIARELTKLHESYYQGSPAEVLADLKSNPSNLKGEFVLVVNKKGTK